MKKQDLKTRKEVGPNVSIVDKAKQKYEQYNEQRRRIIEAAIKVFAEKNYEVGTMAMVAREVGISEAMLYKHFDSKKELFLTCFENIVSELLLRYKECYKRNLDNPMGYLEDTAVVFLNYIKESSNGAKYISHLLSNTFDPDLKKPLADFFTSSVDTITKVIDLAKAKGDINKNADSELMAWLFVSQYYSLIAAKELNEDSMLDEERVRKLVRMLMTGVVPKKA